MKRFALVAAGLAIVAAVVCVIGSDAAFAAQSNAAGLLGAGDLFMANAALLALRTKHGELTRQAEAKRAEVVDGLPADKVRTIEAEHAELVRQAEAVQAEITTAERAAPPAPPAPVDPNAAAQAVLAVERSRVADITALCEQHGLRELLAGPQGMIARGVTIEAANATVLAKIAERSAANPQRPHIVVGRDEGDTIRTAVGNALILRANPQALPADAREAREQARNWRGLSIIEMGREFLRETRGVNMRGMSRMEMATVLLGLETLGSRAAGANSSSDFALLLANTAAKRLRDAYAAAPQTWKPFCRQSNNPDFKEKSVALLSSAPSFKKVREGQEFKYGAMTDGAEKYALATYGEIVAITRQALINDDLGAFDRMPTMIGRAAADLESDTVWNVLLLNPDMSDSVALFHADHGNLLSASAINEAGLTAAELAMGSQRGVAAKAADRPHLNLAPKFLMTGRAKKVEAQKMLTAVTANAASDVNVYAGSMTPIVESRISGNKWFTAADPAQIDTIDYSYLEGEEGVFIEERAGFEVDGIEIKGRLDFAAKAIEYRAFTYNPGA